MPAVTIDREWLAAIAAGEPLVPMCIQPNRLQRAPDGAQDLFYESDVARVSSYLFRPPDGAVLEDGRPLVRAYHIDEVTPGRYMVCRDQIRLRPSDDSDPRTNGRTYVVLVPAWLRDVESRPLPEIRRQSL